MSPAKPEADVDGTDDLPPAPAGLSDAERYRYDVQAWHTRHMVRAIEREGRKTRSAIRGEPEGALATVAGRLLRAPPAVQVVAAMIGYQLLGWGYTAVIGHPPPQVTVPTSIVGAASGSESDLSSPVEPE